MGREVCFELNCSGYQGSVTDIIRLLVSFGWSFFDENGNVEYLPLGDGDSFDWQMAEWNESQISAVLEKKQQRGETLGLVMYYRDTGHGITFLASDIGSIDIIPNICRKTLDDDDDENSITDVNWYVERIVRKLMWYGCKVRSFRFEESDLQEKNE